MNHPNTGHRSDALPNDINTQPPKRCGVFLSNDGYTTMEFVIEILTEVFMFAQGQTMTVIPLVHHEGKGLCDTYTRDIAQTRQHQVMECVKTEGRPLKCTAEEV